MLLASVVVTRQTRALASSESILKISTARRAVLTTGLNQPWYFSAGLQCTVLRCCQHAGGRKWSHISYT